MGSEPRVIVEFLVRIVVMIQLLAVITGVAILGHMMTARWIGVRLVNMRIGLGPRIALFTIGATEYDVRMVPMGSGMSWVGWAEGWRRAVLVTAGYLLVVALYMVCVWTYLVTGVRLAAPTGVRVVQVETRSPAASLRPDDVIVRIGVAVIRERADVMSALGEWRDGSRRVSVRRAGRPVDVEIARPVRTNGNPGRLGFSYESVFEARRFGPLEALSHVPKFGLHFAFYGISAWALSDVATRILPDDVDARSVRAFGILVIIAAGWIMLAELFPIPATSGWDALVTAISALFGATGYDTWRRRLQPIETVVGVSLVLALTFSIIASGRGWLPAPWGAYLASFWSYMFQPNIGWL